MNNKALQEAVLRIVNDARGARQIKQDLLTRDGAEGPEELSNYATLHKWLELTKVEEGAAGMLFELKGLISKYERYDGASCATKQERDYVREVAKV